MNPKKSRRTFLEMASALSLGLPLLSSPLLSCSNPKSARQGAKASKKLNILILGGTSFLGPHQIAYALERGHSISTFTRGKTEPSIHQSLFKNVEALIGDRENDLTALQNRKWDAVIDNSGRNVEWTKASAQLLKDNVDLYLYTSSTGVYFPYLNSDFKEDSEIVMTDPEASKGRDSEYWYGVMKANSELEAKKAFGADRAIIVRPTYMVGPADKTNRFIHWPIRLSKGGEILIPGKATDLVQYMDVRDVAEWMIRLIEEKKAGTYNAVGPKNTQTMHGFAEAAQKTFKVDSTFIKIDDYEFLKENGLFYIVPWIMPEGKYAGSAKISNAKCIANGLSFRPLTETVKDCYDWWYSDALTQKYREEYELNPKSALMREQAIIEAWKNR